MRAIRGTPRSRGGRRAEKPYAREPGDLAGIWVRNMLQIGTGSQKRNPCVYASEESDVSVVPAKQPNKRAGDSPGGGSGGKTGGQGEHYGT